jgi:serine O-acetyltransferase
MTTSFIDARQWVQHTHQWDLDRIVTELQGVRAQYRKDHGRSSEHGIRELPSRSVLQWIVTSLSSVIFPLRLGPADLREESEDFYVGHTLDAALNALVTQVRLELTHQARQSGQASSDIEGLAYDIVQGFADELPRLRRILDSDIIAAYQGDPAARSVDEVLLCYPGIVAIIHHRIANLLYTLGAPLLARVIAEIAHSETGIDIHPGASIDESFFIDHGSGVVIGETAIIGKRVRIYQNVTLGAKRFPKGEDGFLEKGQPRHPLVEDDVVIYAGATILGRVVIGQGSVIGGNVWLTHSVPPCSNIAQAQIRAASDKEASNI